MDKFCWLGLVLASAVIVARPVTAAPVPGLYAATVPVVDTSDEVRLEAYAAALAEVLPRVSGRRDVAADGPTVTILENAERYVQQYTYRQESTLWVAFDGAALERALMEAGLGVWNRDRPSILVWLAVDQGGGDRRLIGSDETDGPKALVEAAARRRGLPLIWPLLDSTDLGEVTAADVWGGFGENVRSASGRYGADAVLVARVRGDAGRELFGSWDFETGAGHQRWRGGIDKGIDGVADYLVSRLAAAAGESGILLLQVTGITDLQAYSATLSYLERLSLIEAVSVAQAQADSVVFRVKVRGDVTRLESAIGVGNVLKPDVNGSMALSFQYVQ